MTSGTEAHREPSAAPAFAHASEAEFARILDFYEVRWEYEPHTFPILWSLDGTVVESFSPDFFLPDLELYVEMTTLRQKLVRKKNRKLRRLRECYPAIRIKLFYGRDFRQLMLKFGRHALADELSGTVGQVVPIRRTGEVGAGRPDPRLGEPVAAAGASPGRSSAAVDGRDGGPPVAPSTATPDGPVTADEGVGGVVAHRSSRNARRRRRRAAARIERGAATS